MVCLLSNAHVLCAFFLLLYPLFLVLAITDRDVNGTMTLLFLYKLIEVLKQYFGEVCEESIRDNFVIIYELFDEMMDFGYPQTTDPKILSKFVVFSSVYLSSSFSVCCCCVIQSFTHVV